MGIDGIGGSKPPVGGLGSVGPGPTGASAGAPFKVESASSSAVGAVSDAERLESGELGLEQYLDARVDQAVSHLAGVVTPEQLDLIKGQLREQLQGSDPVLRRLVQRATGATQAEGDV
jgi:hypothetical protein